MVSGNDPIVEGFVDCVRLAWVVHLMLLCDGNDAQNNIDSTISNDIYPCLEVVFTNNVFKFWLDKVLQTAAYQVGDGS